MMKEVASLWIGRRLGPIELASIKSFQRHGHKFTLYSYDAIENCPCDVIQRDAREVLDVGRIVLHKRTNSPALHSDLFRYALNDKTDFVWVDLDIIAIRPFDFDSDYIFGYEGFNSISSAVLRIPRQSPTLQKLMEVNANSRGIPPNLSGKQWLKYALRSVLTGGVPVEKWPWGTVGPLLMSCALRETGEVKYARPQSVFFPLPLNEAHRAADPNGYSMLDIPQDSYAIHLWGSKLYKYVQKEYNGVFPDGSFVSKILNEQD